MTAKNPEPRFILIDLQTKQVVCALTADQAQVAFWRLDLQQQPKDDAYFIKGEGHGAETRTAGHHLP